MGLRVAVFCAFVIYIAYASPRKFDESSGIPSFVLVGSSKDVTVKKASESDDKNVRSGYSQSYPLVLHSRPSSDYYGYGSNGFGGQLPSVNPQSSLISANVHLLEPFLLVTFLLFVLSLIDKARLSSLLPRRDFLLDRSDIDRNNPLYQKLYSKRNQTEYWASFQFYIIKNLIYWTIAQHVRVKMQ